MHNSNKFQTGLFLKIVACSPLMASCQCKELAGNHVRDNVPVTLKVNWELVSEKPSGMTAMFYPIDGSQPFSFITNNVDSFEVKLPEGTYHYLVFNQTVSEYRSIKFHGMDSWDGMYVELADASKPSWSKMEGNYSGEPGELLVGTSRYFSVAGGEEAGPVTLTVRPHPVAVRTDIDVLVNGVQYAQQARAVISGMAKRYYLSHNATGKELTSFILPEWSIIPFEGDDSDGSFVSSFMSFGLPETYYTDEDLQSITGGRDRIRTKAEVRFETPVNMEMEVLLADNKTVMNRNFSVAGRFRMNVQRLMLQLTVGTPMEGMKDPGNDTPWEMVRVSEPQSTGGGFSVEVDDWGQEQEQEVEM